MIFFCLLWTPVVYFFWVSGGKDVSGGIRAPGGYWGLLLGSVTALLEIFFGPFVKTEGFGLSRWLGILVDLVAVPALIPLILYAPFALIRRDAASLTAFALLALVPQGVAGAAVWIGRRDPSLLVLLPLMWTALAVDIPFFFLPVLKGRFWFLLLALPAVPILLLLAASAYWAFFIHQPVLGYVFAFFMCVPMAVRLAVSFYEEARGPESTP